MDDLDRDLAALAPTIDAEGARQVFDARRTKLRRRRRVATGLVGALAVVAVAGGIAALVDDEAADQIDVGGQGELDAIEFEVLAVNEDPDADVLFHGQLSGAENQRSLADLWSSAGLGGPPPDVDLDRWVVVGFVVDNGCAALVRMDRWPPGANEGPPPVPGVQVLAPVFTPAPCDGPAGPRAFVVAVDRSSLVPGYRLRVPAREGGDQTRFLDRLVSPVQYEWLHAERVPPIGPLLHAAGDEGSWRGLWEDLGFTDDIPPVDFDRWVVVTMRLPADVCATFEGFVGDGDALAAVHDDGWTGCPDEMRGQTTVVALSRAGLPPSRTVELFGEELRLDVESEAAPADVTFEVLGMHEGGSGARLRVATTADQFRALWQSTPFERDPPSIDFAERVVVSITIPDDACPPELTGFDRDGDTITPVFVEPDGGCILPLISKTYVVALDRAPLEPGFRLFLPGQQPYGFGDTSTVVRFDGPPPVPTCNTIEAFAEELRTGIDADTSASSSPSELLGTLTVAFRGFLTGGFAFVGQPHSDVQYVSFEVEVTHRLYEVGRRVGGSGRELVSFTVAVDVDRFAALAAASAGAPVVVIAQIPSGVPVNLLVGHEGLATACEGGPLLGRFGTEGEWAEIDSLEELADAILRP